MLPIAVESDIVETLARLSINQARIAFAFAVAIHSSGVASVMNWPSAQKKMRQLPEGSWVGVGTLIFLRSRICFSPRQLQCKLLLGIYRWQLRQSMSPLPVELKYLFQCVNSVTKLYSVDKAHDKGDGGKDSKKYNTDFDNVKGVELLNIYNKVC